MMRENIQSIRTNGRRTRDLTQHHHGPRGREPDDRQLPLQGLAVQDHGADADGRRGRDGPQPGLGDELTGVPADVEVLQEVVEEVAPDLADDGAGDGGQVEEGGLGVVEEVRGWADELRDGCDDSDGPGEEEHDV